MKNKNIIITINNLNDLKELEKLGIKAYAFPLKGFCVGMPNTFLSSEIPKEYLKNSYLYLNRVLDNAGIDKLKEIIKKLPKELKGIIFDDLGVLEIIKDLKLEKILFLNHFNCNTESIKIYLEYVDSVMVSTDITEEEIEVIIKNIPNKLTLFVLGYVSAMYSRRYLIDNYVKFHKIAYKNPLIIQNGDNEFMVYENEYGTVFYAHNIFDGLSLLKQDAKYFFINSAFLSLEEIKDLLKGNSKLLKDDGFLHKETIYKLKGDKE